MAKISVIVPVYNCSNTIEATLYSILEQTYKNIEVIVIDDGSTDNSLEKINSIKEKDDRVIVLSQENFGVSVARNKGIEISNGEFITFVDGDDYLPSLAIEKMVNAIENSDIVFGGATWIKKEKNLIFSYQDKYIDIKKLNFIDFFNNYNSNSVWSKLYRKDIITNNKIQFYNGMLRGEDSLFLFTYLLFCKKISFIKENVYNYYYFNANFLNKNFSFEDEKRILEVKESLITKNEVYNAYRFLVNEFIVAFYNRLNETINTFLYYKKKIEFVKICDYFCIKIFQYLEIINDKTNIKKLNWLNYVKECIDKSKYKKVYKKIYRIKNIKKIKKFFKGIIKKILHIKREQK